MSGIGWQAHLNECSTQAQIVAACNQFLAMWSRGDLAELPEACHPKDAVALEDVGPYALKLVVQLELVDVASAPMLHRMSTFFTRAALRLAEIRAVSRGHAAHEDQLHTAFLSGRTTG
jgi:hypothetical protein